MMELLNRSRLQKAVLREELAEERCVDFDRGDPIVEDIVWAEDQIH